MDWKEVRKQAMEERPGRAGMLGTASIMGLHMVTGPAVGAGLGWLADSCLDSFPWGAGIGLFLGIAAGVRNVWVDARWLARAEAASDAERKTTSDRSGDSAGASAIPAAPSAPSRRTPDPDGTCTEAPDHDDFGPASLLAGTDGGDPRRDGGPI
ncbi:MAG: AtpZ/AtpI family protein [Mailhella sp.]|nr:AtpZ/AtpI family protein [Mailhella sp.]